MANPVSNNPVDGRPIFGNDVTNPTAQLQALADYAALATKFDVPTFTDLIAVTPQTPQRDSAIRRVVATDTWYYYNGTGWVPLDKRSHAEFLFTRSAIGDSGDGSTGNITVFSTAVDGAATNDTTFLTLPAGTGQTITVNKAGIYDVSFYAQVGAAPTGRFAAEIRSGGALVGASSSPSGANVLSTSVAGLNIAAGAALTFLVSKTTGGNANVDTRIRITRTASF